MNDDIIFKILLIVTIIALAMLNQYSNYVEYNAYSDAVSDDYIGNRLITGKVVNFRETNSSYIIDLQMNNTISVIAVKNDFSHNLSLSEGDEIIAESDFTDFYTALEQGYFASQIIGKEELK